MKVHGVGDCPRSSLVRRCDPTTSTRPGVVTTTTHGAGGPVMHPPQQEPRDNLRPIHPDEVVDSDRRNAGKPWGPTGVAQRPSLAYLRTPTQIVGTAEVLWELPARC